MYILFFYSSSIISNEIWVLWFSWKPEDIWKSDLLGQIQISLSKAVLYYLVKGLLSLWFPLLRSNVNKKDFSGVSFDFSCIFVFFVKQFFRIEADHQMVDDRFYSQQESHWEISFCIMLFPSTSILFLVLCLWGNLGLTISSKQFYCNNFSNINIFIK